MNIASHKKRRRNQKKIRRKRSSYQRLSHTNKDRVNTKRTSSIVEPPTINEVLPAEVLSYVLAFLSRDLDPLLWGVCRLWRDIVHQLPANQDCLPPERATMRNVLCWAAEQGRNDLFFHDEIRALERKRIAQRSGFVGSTYRQLAWLSASVRMFWSSTVNGVYSPQYTAAIKDMQRIDTPYGYDPKIQRAAIMGGHVLILKHVFAHEPGITPNDVGWGIRHLAPIHSILWLLENCECLGFEGDTIHPYLSKWGLMAAHVGHQKALQYCVESCCDAHPILVDWFQRAVLMCHRSMVAWCLQNKLVVASLCWIWPARSRADVLFLFEGCETQFPFEKLFPSKDDDEDDEIVDERTRRGWSLDRQWRTWRCYVIGAQLDWLAWKREKTSERCPFPRLKELFDDGVAMHPQITVHVAGQGNIPALDWLARHGCPFHQAATLEAATLGQLEALKWLRKRKSPWNEAKTAYMARNQPHVLAWIREHGELGEMAGYTFSRARGPLIARVVQLNVDDDEREPIPIQYFNLAACSDFSIEPPYVHNGNHSHHRNKQKEGKRRSSFS